MSLRYEMKTSIFNKIPGSPLAYWISTKMANVFNNPTLYNYSYSPSQNITGNNERLFNDGDYRSYNNMFISVRYFSFRRYLI